MKVEELIEEADTTIAGIRLAMIHVIQRRRGLKKDMVRDWIARLRRAADLLEKLL